MMIDVKKCSVLLVMCYQKVLGWRLRDTIVHSLMGEHPLLSHTRAKERQPSFVTRAAEEQKIHSVY